MAFEQDFEELLKDACNEAIRDFRQTDEIYRQSVKRRAAISPLVELLAEHEGEYLLTDEMRNSLVEYITLLTGPKELEVLVACYAHGMRDVIQLLRRLDALKDQQSPSAVLPQPPL